MEIYKLDRIEENLAVMEDKKGNMFSFSKELLPENSKSGDCFIIEDEKFVFHKKETETRRKKIFSLLSELK
ncbi:MAG: DUF3006 domain-containing protein [Oscillospiraceae bacterium]|nr:DUF3006 domain-containing protein [Oscillospiraceae bacterium]